MTEFDRIVQALDSADASAFPAVLLTVVHISGSSFRRSGARMLVLNNGEWLGSISGGCLEGDILERSKRIMHSQQCTVQRYDTREEANAVFGLGLGCEGVIDVLMEPIQSANSPTIEMLRNVRSIAGLTQHIVVVESHLPEYPIGFRWNVTQNESAQCLPDFLRAESDATPANLKTRLTTLSVQNTELRCLIEVLKAPPRCHLFGAGDDVVALQNALDANGFDLTIGDRSEYKLSRMRKSIACILHRMNAEYSLSEHSIQPGDFAVLATHSLRADCLIMAQLATMGLRYVGVIGPAARREKLLTILKHEYQLDVSTLTPILFAPAGLDIGAESPEQIASSIVAEMLAVLHNRLATSLRQRQSPIHDESHASHQ